MRRYLMRGTASLIALSTVLLAGVGVASAKEESAPVAAESAPVVANAGIVTADGTVIAPGDSVTFTFKGDAESPVGSPDAPNAPARCDNDPPTYSVTGTPYFITDRSHPQSTWLLPRQSVSWTVTGSHTFTWDIGVGVEAEAGAIIAKAKASIDTKISNSWTWTGTQTVSDTNSTSTGYRAVLGQVGWKLTGVKEWVAGCKSMSKTIIVIAPRQGDMSIGREGS